MVSPAMLTMRVHMALAPALRQHDRVACRRQPLRVRAAGWLVQTDFRNCDTGDEACELALQGREQFLVGGNWSAAVQGVASSLSRLTASRVSEANGSSASIKALAASLNAAQLPENVQVVCAAPFVYLPLAQSQLSARFEVAAQNCRSGGAGAFTGEVLAEQLADLQVPWVVLGHSERRAMYGDTDAEAAAKASLALRCGLQVMFCIGETLGEREAGLTLDVCRRQLQALVDKVGQDLSNVVIAYEPVWAIGTGKVASPAQAQEVHLGIRSWLAATCGHTAAVGTRILYGGSVSAGNCQELAGQPDIDGFLVGGASLKAADFISICQAGAVKALA